LAERHGELPPHSSERHNSHSAPADSTDQSWRRPRLNLETPDDNPPAGRRKAELPRKAQSRYSTRNGNDAPTANSDADPTRREPPNERGRDGCSQMDSGSLDLSENFMLQLQNNASV
jgi:hypothetical protein